MGTLLKSAQAAAGLALALIGLLAGCRSPEPAGADGAAIRFHNWWNYYERAGAFMAQGNYAAARSDLERALGVKAGAKFGRDDDTWRARTYGLHFVEGYFPNRELGISLYRLGDLKGAGSFLEKSMGQTPSGRAKYFLNLVRKSQLSADTAPPVISLSDKSVVELTSERERELSGVARGEGLVSGVSVNGQPDFIELAEREKAFSRHIPLRPGTNVVSVTVEDLHGRRAGREITWIADWIPPHFLVTRATPAAGGWKLEGRCVDGYGLRHVSVNGREMVKKNEAKPAPDEVAVEATMINNMPCLVEAEDLAGNKFRAIIDEKSLGDVVRASRGAVLLADASPAGQADVPAEPAAPARDAQRPAVRFSSPAAEEGVVWRDECFLDGWAEDGALASVTVNGEELVPAQHRGSISVRFTRWLPVDEGTNVFEVVASDKSGNKTIRSLRVVRRKPAFLDDDMRLSVGLPPPGHAADPAEVGKVTRLAAGELSRNPIRFQLLERDEGWDYILREQKLSLSDLSDPGAAIPIGKMLPADMLIMLEILKRDQGSEIYARVVETSDGQVLCEEDVYDVGEADSLARQVAGLVMKIEQRFPVVAGVVKQANGGRATISVGARDGVMTGSKFVVLESAKGAGVEGAPGVRMLDGKRVELVAQNVRDGETVAKIFPEDAKKSIRAGDSIYAR